MDYTKAMKSVILIPARMASTRLPNKPLVDIGGAPMIVQVWKRAVAAALGEVFVACDGEMIAKAITDAGGKAIFTDPDLPSGSDRIYAALSTIDPQKKYEAVVNLQGDMPTVDARIIQDAVSLLEHSNFDITTLAAPITNERDKSDPAVVKVVRDGSRAVTFTRQTPTSEPLLGHIGIYVYRRAALEKFVSLPPSPLEKKEKLEQLRALEAGMTIGVAIVKEAPVGVDTQETLELARTHYEKK